MQFGWLPRKIPFCFYLNQLKTTQSILFRLYNYKVPSERERERETERARDRECQSYIYIFGIFDDATATERTLIEIFLFCSKIFFF